MEWRQVCWVQQTCFHSLSGLLWGGVGVKEKEKQAICLTPALSPPIVDHPFLVGNFSSQNHRDNTHMVARKVLGLDGVI